MQLQKSSGTLPTELVQRFCARHQASSRASRDIDVSLRESTCQIAARRWLNCTTQCGSLPACAQKVLLSPTCQKLHGSCRSAMDAREALAPCCGKQLQTCNAWLHETW